MTDLNIIKREEWRPVVGCESIAEVSNRGRVRTLDRRVRNRFNTTRLIKGRILGGFKPLGYPMVQLGKKKYLVHRLVAMAFIENPKNLPFVNHIDNIRGNANVENLEWCTPAENSLDAKNRGVIARGETQGNSRLTEANVLEIRRLRGKRQGYALARKFGVHRSTVDLVGRGVTWKHLPL